MPSNNSPTAPRKSAGPANPSGKTASCLPRFSLRRIPPIICTKSSPPMRRATCRSASAAMTASRFFLNGKQVHANNIGRGAAADQDKITVKLRKGANHLLLKNSQWSRAVWILSQGQCEGQAGAFHRRHRKRGQRLHRRRDRGQSECLPKSTVVLENKKAKDLRRQTLHRRRSPSPRAMSGKRFGSTS